MNVGKDGVAQRVAQSAPLGGDDGHDDGGAGGAARLRRPPARNASARSSRTSSSWRPATSRSSRQGGYQERPSLYLRIADPDALLARPGPRRLSRLRAPARERAGGGGLQLGRRAPRRASMWRAITAVSRVDREVADGTLARCHRSQRRWSSDGGSRESLGAAPGRGADPAPHQRRRRQHGQRALPRARRPARHGRRHRSRRRVHERRRLAHARRRARRRAPDHRAPAARRLAGGGARRRGRAGARRGRAQLGRDPAHAGQHPRDAEGIDGARRPHRLRRGRHRHSQRDDDGGVRAASASSACSRRSA